MLVISVPRTTELVENLLYMLVYVCRSTHTRYKANKQYLRLESVRSSPTTVVARRICIGLLHVSVNFHLQCQRVNRIRARVGRLYTWKTSAVLKSFLPSYLQS